MVKWNIIYIGMIKYYGYCFIKFTSGTSSGWSCCINLMDKSGDKVLNIPSTINNLDIPDELDLVDYSNQTAYTLLTSKTYLLS